MKKSVLINCLFILLTYCAVSQTVDPKKSKEYFTKAQQSYSVAKYKDAVEYYTLSINADSTNTNAWIRRGFTRGLLKDFDGEMSDYSSVINFDPQHKWAYISRGSARNRLGDYKNAMADFNKAIEIDSKDPEAYNNRGFTKKAMGDKEGACDDWNKSKKLGNDEAKIILKNNHCR